MLEYALVFRPRSAKSATKPATAQKVEEIFVVPVCSMLATSMAAYIEFLQAAGAWQRATEVVEAANLKRPQAAEMVRRTVRAIVTEAEVQALAPQISSLSL